MPFIYGRLGRSQQKFEKFWFSHLFLCSWSRWFRISHLFCCTTPGRPCALHFNAWENVWEVKKSKWENHIKWGSNIFKMMRGSRSWPQSSNWITFEPFFGQKLSKYGICQFSAFFWPTNGSDVIRFEFWAQIWDPLLILHILGPHLIWFPRFVFLTSHAG